MEMEKFFQGIFTRKNFTGKNFLEISGNSRNWKRWKFLGVFPYFGKSTGKNFQSRATGKIGKILQDFHFLEKFPVAGSLTKLWKIFQQLEIFLDPSLFYRSFLFCKLLEKMVKNYRLPIFREICKVVVRLEVIRRFSQPLH